MDYSRSEPAEGRPAGAEAGTRTEGLIPSRCEAPLMGVGILLVTHGKLGGLLVETMVDLIGELPLATDVLEVRRVQATDVLLRQGERTIERLDSGAGVLILTDTYGSTPSNIANRLASNASQVEVVAGLNLPMLLRLYNYPKLALSDLAQAAAEGGQRGIVICPRVAAAKT
jgi:PTS system mannose-specific IIA component